MIQALVFWVIEGTAYDGSIMTEQPNYHRAMPMCPFARALPL